MRIVKCFEEDFEEEFAGKRKPSDIDQRPPSRTEILHF